MKCDWRTEAIALYIEGDLPAKQALELEQHIQSCDACRQFLTEMASTETIFKSLNSEFVEPAILRNIRSRVLEEVVKLDAPRGWFWGGLRWRYALFGAVALLFGLAAVWQLRVPSAPQQKPLVPVAVVIEQPKPPDLVVVKAEPVRPRVSKRRIAPPKPAGTEDMVVQIQTNDPNIVIYWLIEQGGHE